MSTHEAVVSDYMRLKAAGGVVVNPPAPAAAALAPDAERKAAERHAISLLTPAAREAEAERVATIAAAAPQTPAPPPRELLRQAHAQRAEAQREASRLQSAVDRAREHLTEVETARDEARRSLDALEAENTAQLIADLATGSAGRVDPVAGETRVQLAECEHQVTIASRASDKLASDLAAAQQHLEAAVRAVMEAVCAVLLAEAERQAVAILAAVEALDDRRRALDSLAVEISNRQRVGGPSRLPWPAAIREALSPELRAPARMPSQFVTAEGAALIRQWSAAAAALLADPEADIGESV